MKEDIEMTYKMNKRDSIIREPKRIPCYYKGRTELIPKIWLAGRSQMRQREGRTVADAYTQAIIDWFEQSDLAAEYQRTGAGQMTTKVTSAHRYVRHNGSGCLKCGADPYDSVHQGIGDASQAVKDAQAVSRNESAGRSGTIEQLDGSVATFWLPRKTDAPDTGGEWARLTTETDEILAELNAEDAAEADARETGGWYYRQTCPGASRVIFDSDDNLIGTAVTVEHAAQIVSDHNAVRFALRSGRN
jgi:hypothetical protein